MKLRFLAAAGPSGARDVLTAQLQKACREPRLEPVSAGEITLWTEPGTPLLRDDSGSALAVGLLFDRTRGRRFVRLPNGPELERALISDSWGSYILFTATAASHSVLRDPSCAIPVYYGKHGALQLYASDADMLRLAWSEPLRPSLDAARHWLRFQFLRTARTGAVGISELLPGMVHECRPESARLRQAWSPQPFAGAVFSKLTFPDAAALLREEILRSVPLMAAHHPNVVLQLSGGLDSSILAAALAHGAIRFRAMTFATQSADGDERRYAGEVARRFGIDLQVISEAEIDSSALEEPDPLRRPSSPLLQPLRRAFTSAAGEDALLLDGGGGDNVFASLNSASPAIDALRQHGVGAAVRTLQNLSNRHACTFWAAARSALRRASRSRTLPWPADDTFLLPTCGPQAPDAHPWLAASDRPLPGSADHLRMIVGIHHFLADPGAGQPCNLHPLICQPIIEQCLRIPSWLWVERGCDRAVARAAFRALLPDSVVERRGKGSLQSMFVKGFMARRSELRENLVAGRLAQEGLIDGKAIASYLDRNDEPRDARYIRILEIASTEQWLRSFVD